MDGDPVWLASISKRSPLNGQIQFVPEWTNAIRDHAEVLILTALDHAGDSTRERLFRMNVTLCLHRALTAAEVARLPSWFSTKDAEGLAGGPVAILRETVRGSDSTRPCEHPVRTPLPGGLHGPFAWFPRDCQSCGPCRARARL